MSSIEPTQPAAGPRPAPARPSLLSTHYGSGAPSGGERAVRLLSALRPDEDGPRPTRSGRTKGLVAFVTLALAGAAALVLATNTDSSGNPDVAMMGTTPAAVADAPQATIPAASASVAPPTGASSVGQVVERDANQAADGPARVETSSGGVAASPAMAVGTEAASAPQAAEPAPVSAKAPPARRVRSRSVPTKLPVTAGAHARGDTRAGAPARDPDADLVAAIMARMEPVGAASNAPAGDRAGTIASLVGDCNAMRDSDSALACRRRICEGYWGKAQACPRSMSPAASGR